MSTPKYRSLKLHEWPRMDREAWELACRPAIKLQKGGPAAHLKPVSQNDLAKRYGLFFDYIARSAHLDLDAAPGFYVTPRNVDGYLAELKTRVTSVTLYGNIHKLRRFTQLIRPGIDLQWLKEVEQDLDWAKRPTPKFDRIVYSDRIVRAGLSLMEEAEVADHIIPLRRARSYRNGLMITFLPVMPIRLKNFSALAIGKHLVKFRGKWQLVISAAETKSQRSDERPVPGFLTARLDKYVEVYRPLLEPKSGELWVSTYGGALSYTGCERIITETTRATLDVPMSPHLFRSSAASTAYLYAGGQPHLATGLLHHTDTTTTERHYNRARGSSYGSCFSRLIESSR